MYLPTGPAKAGHYDHGPAKAGHYGHGPAKAGHYDHGPAKAGHYDHSPAKAGHYAHGPAEAGHYCRTTPLLCDFLDEALAVLFADVPGRDVRIVLENNQILALDGFSQEGSLEIQRIEREQIVAHHPHL